VAKIEVDSELCKGCRLCIGTCPQKIIRIGEKSNSKGYKYLEQFDASKCTACKLCALMCPEAAISVFK